MAPMPPSDRYSITTYLSIGAPGGDPTASMRAQCTIASMRRPGAYPLEPLRALRDAEKRARTIDLAGAVAAEQAAAEALAALRIELPATAAFLAAVEARAGVLRARLAAEDRAVARAREVLRDAERVTAEARGEVGAARARGEIVERHRERWVETE